MSVHAHLCPCWWLLLYFRPRSCQPGCVQAAVVTLRLTGFLNQSLTATRNRKILLCHQPKVALKEQFSWTSDWLLTQKVAAEFPVARADLEGSWVGKRGRRGAALCTLLTCREAPSLDPSGLNILFLEKQALPSGLIV